MGFFKKICLAFFAKTCATCDVVVDVFVLVIPVPDKSKQLQGAKEATTKLPRPGMHLKATIRALSTRL